MSDIVFLDTEVSPDSKKINDIGAIKTSFPVKTRSGAEFHNASIKEFSDFVRGAFYYCGHNIVDFDSKYLGTQVDFIKDGMLIDTLYLSPLLFPKKPYHRLVKDDKLITEEINNPLNDSYKCMELFMDETGEYGKLDDDMKRIFYSLLSDKSGYKAFFKCMGVSYDATNLGDLIHKRFKGKICENASLGELIYNYPIELSYVLSVINADDRESIIPSWVNKRYPDVTNVFRTVRGIPCKKGCTYCDSHFDLKKKLKEKFGYDDFRTYNGEALQEKAARAAVEGQSLLAIFPTGGGKSLTFQLPALMAAETVKGLTVVISPLQSLMKDQVDSLAKRGISDAVTINGLLNPVERKEAIERVESGIASILYIAPESLRSRTIERLLLSRNVVRVVIDEAHCFSSWGQDFRVDYLYIGDFIAMLKEKTGHDIPVSCFTATAKQKVISDIRAYFDQKLGVKLSLFTTDAARKNLRYEVIYRETDQEKYQTLRDLIDQRKCPTIVFASRTKKTVELAKKLQNDGFNAAAFHGQMDQDEKIKNQNAFMSGEVSIMVATSAFGMGVDKSDIGLVIHYDISDSLENYVQEAGRAGRDEHIDAECYVLFNENDLNKHFMLLNQTKLSISEVQQVWRGIKNLSQGRERITSSAYDIAKAAGWNIEPANRSNLETKVKTAISALELSGYIKRGNNAPRVYADSLNVNNMIEARKIIENSGVFDTDEIRDSVRIIEHLISYKHTKNAKNSYETQTDQLSDTLGMEQRQTVNAVNKLKLCGVLSDDKEMAAFVKSNQLNNKQVLKKIDQSIGLEKYILCYLMVHDARISFKELNESANEAGYKASVNDLKELFYFWTIKGYINKPQGETDKTILIDLKNNIAALETRMVKRDDLCEFIVEYFTDRAQFLKNVNPDTESSDYKVDFSAVGLKKAYDERITMFEKVDASLSEIEEALLYLTRLRLYRIEGGLLVYYNAMVINRLEMDNRIKYKKEDYKHFEDYYRTRTEQIHIVGEYANMVVRDYEAALVFVNDYFQMDYNLFLKKYFAGDRMKEIGMNITPEKYHELFEKLTERQTKIINDDTSKTIVVAAGPGSGKTMILVHKLASLLLLEDVKHEQLLMLTFSRAAAMEFKQRLHALIGNSANYVEIKTFHSYAFDILGRVGNLEKSQDVVKDAADYMMSEDVELDKVTKTVLVIDEAQDMDANEFALVNALININEDIRIIAVGDDDQNIYQFRGSDSKYMNMLLEREGATMYELVENFRSDRMITDVANIFAENIENRLKKEAVVSMSENPGEVITVMNNSSLINETVKIFKHYHKNEGSTAILTGTNIQAGYINYCLRKEGYEARLIEAIESFALYDLDEFRFFLESIKRENEVVVDDKIWNEAISSLETTFAGDIHLERVLYVLENFKATYDKIYYHDLVEMLKESKFADFYKCSDGEIVISTIHKSKGHEFDNVYLILDGKKRIDDKVRRAIYVGLTRAKKSLYIITSGNCFESQIANIKAIGGKIYEDKKVYEDPAELIISFGHRDIWLGFWSEVNAAPYGRFKPGDELEVFYDAVEKNFFFMEKDGEVGNYLAAASKAMQTKLANYFNKGYTVKKATINSVVHWVNKEDKKENKIILPEIVMEKR